MADKSVAEKMGDVVGQRTIDKKSGRVYNESPVAIPVVLALRGWACPAS